ncbi:MAG: P-II family nitrogen regulator [Propionibacteriaceae bacterium]|nr:P-II family nitrogen regulator [Propionibacteriaceae bacterium]
MKKIEAIIRTNEFLAVKNALYAIEVHGMTVSEVHGCGKQKGKKEIYRGAEVYVDLLRKMKLEIVCHDETVEDIIRVICQAAHTGMVGDGKIFVMPVEQVIRIRTGERGEAAV